MSEGVRIPNLPNQPEANKIGSIVFFTNVTGWIIDLSDDESSPQMPNERDENHSHIEPSEIDILKQPIPVSLQRLIEQLRDAEDKKT